MKGNIEKLVKSAENIVKGSLGFIKDNYKTLSMIGALGTAGYFVDQNINKAKGAEIQVTNFTSSLDTTIDKMNGLFRTFGDANETLDYHDGSFVLSQKSYALEVSSNEPGFKARVNAKPLNTPEGIFNFGFYSLNGQAYNGTLSNTAKVKVSDSSGLEHRKVIAYDANNPSIKYDIPKSGTIININLPSLVNPSPGVYRNIVIETPANIKGDIASESGVGVLDGKVDYWDLAALTDQWLQHTNEGQNYLWGDVDYSGDNDFYDFADIAGNWMVSE